MQITVVILNWNRCRDTIRAAVSALSQRHRDTDIILWDNHSEHGDFEELNRRFADEHRIRIIRGDANYGVAGGRNRAFSLGRGRIIVSIDSDAVFQNADVLDLTAHHFTENQSTGVMAYEVVRPDGHLMWPFVRRADHWRTRSFKTIRMDGCGFAVRNDLFNDIGGFPEHFSPYGAEDQYFAHRVLAAGYDIVYEPAAVVEHTFSNAGRTPLQFRMHVRNMLWIPMELYPFPSCIIRMLKQMTELYIEAIAQRRLAAYVVGIRDAFLQFRFRRRHPYTREQWKRFTSLVKEDKSHR